MKLINEQLGKRESLNARATKVVKTFKTQKLNSKGEKMKTKIHILAIFIITVGFLFSKDSSAYISWNQACSFAGNGSSYIAVKHNSSLNLHLKSFIIEAWVKPTNISGNRIILQKRNRDTHYGYTLYLNSGRVAFKINDTLSIVATDPLPLNEWSHIRVDMQVRIDGSRIYLYSNNISEYRDEERSPLSNSDSLFIGEGNLSSFAGEMDDVRIFSNQTSSTLNSYNLDYTTLGANSGIYKDLKMSLTFQDYSSSSPNFSLKDWSSSSNHGINRGVIAVDLSNRPSETINLNQGIRVGGTEYLAGQDDPAVSPTAGLTLEAWIYPSYSNSNSDMTIIHKGSPVGGAGTNYGLKLSGRKIAATINGSTKISNDTVPEDKWTHVAFTYSTNGFAGVSTFYLNGKKVHSSLSGSSSQIVDGLDSLYIGGTRDLPAFKGDIDEVRITNYAKSKSEINKFLFTSVDDANMGIGTKVVYNFDGYVWSSTGLGPKLYFRNIIDYDRDFPFFYSDLVSPIVRSDILHFSDGFYKKVSDRVIPASGSSGYMIDDTLKINFNETISDINVFVALNHREEQDLRIYLYAPNGQSVRLYNYNFLKGSPNKNIVTIFDDNSNTSLQNDKYISFGPDIRPDNNLNSTFAGISSRGKWRLQIYDANIGNTGRLYGWSIQFNNRESRSSILSLNCLTNGMYNPVTNLTLSDTITCHLRNSLSPYSKIDSSKYFLNPDGSADFSFINEIMPEESYYVQLKHRNSIETWSSGFVTFDVLNSQASYDFTSDSSQAFGNNQIKVDNSPVRYAIYSGDVNQDGTIDASDLSSIDNDAFNSVSGYVNTDLSGDDFVDGSDLLIADNNAGSNVIAITP